MMDSRSTTLGMFVALACSALFAFGSGAAPVEFTIDEGQSKITVSGSVANAALKEQGPGSLTTTCYGKLVADLTAEAIRFTGGSVLAARTNGVWKPGPGGAPGSAPADFAGQATILFSTIRGALRDVVLDLTSGVLPITTNHFDASALLFSFPTNLTASFDYDAGFLGTGGISMGGIATNQIVNGATVTSSADGQTLTIQVDTEFRFDTPVPGIVHLNGMLVASRMILPIITSVLVQNDTVLLRVEGTGPTPGMSVSADLVNWVPVTPTLTNDASGLSLIVPATGDRGYFRVSK